MARRLDAAELDRQLASLPSWRGDMTALHREARMPDFPAAIRVVDDVALEAEDMDHHPDIDIRWRTVRFTLSTHSQDGVTQLDVELAHRIDEVVRRHGGE